MILLLSLSPSFTPLYLTLQSPLPAPPSLPPGMFPPPPPLCLSRKGLASLHGHRTSHIHPHSPLQGTPPPVTASSTSNRSPGAFSVSPPMKILHLIMSCSSRLSRLVPVPVCVLLLALFVLYKDRMIFRLSWLSSRNHLDRSDSLQRRFKWIVLQLIISSVYSRRSPLLTFSSSFFQRILRSGELIRDVIWCVVCLSCL
jgi:hypothetical protein